MPITKFNEKEAYESLNKFNEGEESYLGNPIESLITQIMEAVDGRNYPGAVYFIDIAVEVAKSMGGILEQAETHCKCGYAYYRMENYLKAITEYRHAISYYDIVHPHNQALTNWLLGYALWRTMKLSNAIVVWEKSCNRFQKLRANASENKEDEQAEWYEEIGKIMCIDLAKAIQFGRWPYEEPPE